MIYLIGGVARSGKSTVRALMLRKYGISGIDTDTVRSMIEHAAPELGVSYLKKPRENARKMSRYLEGLVRARFFFEDDYVIEGDALLPKLIGKMIKTKKAKGAVLGMPKVDAGKKLRAIRARETRDAWTRRLNDPELLASIEELRRESLRLEKECAAWGVPFFDVSRDFEKTIDGIVVRLVRGKRKRR